MPKYQVTIDKDLEDLIPGYLENRKKDIISLKKNLAEKDFESARVTGHSMKGSGGGYGFTDISDIGKIIEDSAKDKKEKEIQEQIKRLEDYVNNLEISYQ